MRNSAASPRAALLARSRTHFVAIAAAGAVLAGGVTAYAAAAGTATQPLVYTGSENTDTTTGTTSGIGLTGPSSHANPDASSNAS